MSQNYRKVITDGLARLVGKESRTNRPQFCISKASSQPELHLPITQEIGNLRSTEGCPEWNNLIENATVVQQGRNQKLVCRLHRNRFVHEVLGNLSLERKSPANPQKTLVEFSSPNIAKPFHAGHLRSTIIGNFLANLYDHLGHDVVRLNYLGDWGTQFGYLKLGVDLKGLSREDIRRNPIESLYEAYVYAYGKAEDSPELQDRARQIFSELENGTFSELDTWSDFRSYTVDELKQVYERLGTRFDQYHWESQYGVKDISHVINLLQEQKVLVTQEDGRKVVKVGNRNVPIVKSDGTTLYLTRDVAALMDRFERFRFDNAFYVVDNSQSDHFSALISIAQQLNLSYAASVSHVKFGRVLGMSTRKGTVVFLKDILDEAEAQMKQKQLNTKTTKSNALNNPKIATILGTTAVVVNDLKQRRTRDYDFSWDRALQSDGDTGIKLQYTHCRLSSLEKNAAEQPAIECKPELLPEPEALALVCELVKFEDVLAEAAERREACILVNYLFGLCNATSRALQTLHVMNEPSRERRLQRLLLFGATRKTLRRGMEILGLEPLEEM